MLGGAAQDPGGDRGLAPGRHRFVVESSITLPVQINGKKRADVTIARDAGNSDIEAACLGLECKKALGKARARKKGHCRPASGTNVVVWDPTPGRSRGPVVCFSRPAGLGGRFSHLGLAGVGRAFFALRLAGVGGLFLALGLAGLVAGRFQPLYAEHPLRVGAAGNPGIVGQLRAVDVAPIDTPAGSRLARVSVNVRNELIYDLTAAAVFRDVLLLLAPEARCHSVAGYRRHQHGAPRRQGTESIARIR